MMTPIMILPRMALAMEAAPIDEAPRRSWWNVVKSAPRIIENIVARDATTRAWTCTGEIEMKIE
jgi:hypothetical protein